MVELAMKTEVVREFATRILTSILPSRRHATAATAIARSVASRERLSADFNVDVSITAARHDMEQF